jgi:hypothetical protein
MADLPPGYRFFRIVIIVGAVGFGLLGAFYLISGQPVPGLFALFVALVEALALPLFRKLFETSKAGKDNAPPE